MKVLRNGILLVAFLLLAGVVFGIGTTGAQDQPVIKFWLWNWDSPLQQETWTQSVQKFTAETGIKVDIFTVEWDKIGEKLRAASIAGNPPDVALVLHSDYVWLARGGFLRDITEEANREMDLSDFIPSALDSVKIDGKLYGLPWRRAGYALVYNDLLFSQAGIEYPPRTLEEIKADAAIITQKLPGVYGWAMPLGRPGGAFMRWQNIFYSYGGDWLNEEKTDVAPSFMEAAVKAFQFVRDIWEFVPPSSIQDTDDDVLKMASLGKIAMWQDHLSALDSIDKLFPPELKEHIKYALFPSGVPSMESGITAVGDWDIVIPKASINLDAAWEFVKYWETGENMGELDQLPARKSGMSVPRIAEIPEAFRIGTTKITLSEPFQPTIQELVVNGLQSIVLDRATPQEVAEAIAAKIRAFLSEEAGR